MTDFERVKMYYDNGWATKEQVKLYVQYVKITETEYEQITAEVYVA